MAHALSTESSGWCAGWGGVELGWTGIGERGVCMCMLTVWQYDGGSSRGMVLGTLNACLGLLGLEADGC